MYLGLDLGTGSIKAALVDPESRLRWIGETSYDLPIVQDRAEFDPETWWSACCEVLRAAPSDLVEDVRAVGLSGQMHGLVLVGADRSLVRPAILWPDRRARSEVAAFESIEHARPGSLANPIGPGMPGPMLLWLRRHQPDIFARIETIVSPKDWLRSKLTGEAPIVTEPSDASATLMYDARSVSWSLEVHELLGLSTSQLPTIVSSESVTGRLTSEAARATGLPVAVPVAAGAADSAAALFGLGADTPGSLVLNVGTAGQALSPVDDVDVDFPSAGLHQYRTAGRGATWYVMAPVLNAGLALTWARTMLGLAWDELFGHAGDALDRAVGDPVFLPFLVGERDPEIGLDARGAWLDLTAEHDRSAMARSALVGVASSLAHRTRHLLELTNATRVIMSGGSMRNSGWTQLITDLLGTEVDLAVDGHASVRGAARTAAASQGAQMISPPIARRLVPQDAHQQIGRGCLDRLLGSNELLLAHSRKLV